MQHQVAIPLGSSTLTIETGKVAKQANGSAFVRYGDTVVLATACSSKPREGIDFFPLTVDYREYTYAAGKIPGGFFKREGRPTEKEILTSRQIDRPVRPLFTDGYRDETQVIAMVLSADESYNPDVIGVTAGATALYLSDIPFSTPIAAVRVGLVEGRLVTNPTYAEIKSSLLNLVVAGSEDAIVMVECAARELSEDAMIDAIQYGHGEIRKIVAAQKELFQKLGIKKRAVAPPVHNEALAKDVAEKSTDKLRVAMDTSKQSKLESERAIKALREELLAGYPEDDEDLQKEVKHAFEALYERMFRDDVLLKHQRPDRRAFDQVRSITCEVGLLPRTHGSALFTRGETQALVTATLGTAEDQQRLDVLEGESFKRFMLHYNFPPFSVGETGFLRGPGRREIGHGNLAERALLSMIPEEDQFPYTLRVVSDILESNGSSSMATVCGGCLALMDAGVPIKDPVAGIAMGLVKEGEKYAILTDIAGAEDHYGDMDFKVAGTAKGITALQMDIKIGGITTAIMHEAMEQAKVGRLHVLGKMLEVLPEPRTAVSTFAPRIYTLRINPSKIGELIGPGGKTIRGIIEQTGVKIDVEDDGRVNVAAADSAAADKALKIIKDMMAEAELGKTYLGKVVRLAEFGAFVEIFPGTDGLLHISEVAEHRIQDIRKELKEGDQLLVKVISIEGNKIRLSRKAVLRDQRQKTGAAAAPQQ
ncbi:MAG TPA: polyribonucleotide nucleotidyltransferase [Terriglobia bacterium]|jgi:polyribonucleotide nucleotidyltransferase|nr:polyribonucleotide nucleotidyltransferase [Terriglobia bacterium]